MWSRLSLRFKFLSLVIPLAIFISLVFFLFIDNQLKKDAQGTLADRIEELTRVQSGSISGPLWSFNILQLNLVTSSMINDPDVVGVSVLDETGAVVAADGVQEANLEDRIFMRQRTVSFFDDGTKRDIGELRVFYSEERLLADAVTRRLTALVAIALLIGALIIGALVGLHYTVLVPLGRFATAIGLARDTDQVVPVDWNTQDEMGNVAHAFNDLQSQQKSDEAELRRIQDNLEDLVEKRTETLAQREVQLVGARDKAEHALEELRATQSRLIQSQKMASLGQLSAGIAHEIKNPLNFVNNFSLMSVEMLGELKEALAAHNAAPTNETKEEIAELTQLLSDNLEKIEHHGHRADNIVRNMLLHSRDGPADFRQAQINNVLREAVNLAFHSARAEVAGFNITIHEELDSDLPETFCVPQDLSRVFINLASNAMYATHQKTKKELPGYEPLLEIHTAAEKNRIRIDVRDNGEGIPQSVREQVFEPFFTSKPTGEGTGLGLSLAYDIVHETHRGDIRLESEEGEGTTFTVFIPLVSENPDNKGDKK